MKIRQLFLLYLVFTLPVFAATPTYDIKIKNHLFEPAQLTIPSGKKVKLRIHNEDETAEEFESYELNREKVIMGGRKGTIFIGPLTPGSYPFFGEFNPKTAQGVIIVEDKQMQE